MEEATELQISCIQCSTELIKYELTERHAFIFKGTVTKGYLLRKEHITSTCSIEIDANLFFTTDQTFDQELIFKFVICSSCKKPVGKQYMTCNRRLKFIKEMVFIHTDYTQLVIPTNSSHTNTSNLKSNGLNNERVSVPRVEISCQMPQTSIDFDCLMADVDQCMIQTVHDELTECQEDTAAICKHIQAQGSHTACLMGSVSYSKELLHAIIEAYRVLCTLIITERSLRN